VALCLSIFFFLSFFHPDLSRVIVNYSSSFLLTGCLDGVVRLFSFRTAHINQKPCFEWTDHEVPISAVAISEDGQYVVAGSEEGKIIVWNTEDGEETLSYNVSKSGK